MAGMLKEGAALDIFTVKAADLKSFAADALSYGIKYCVVSPKGRSDGIVDIMVRPQDAARVQRIVERFGYSDVMIEQLEKEAEMDLSNNRDLPGAGYELRGSDDIIKDLEVIMPEEEQHPQLSSTETVPFSAKEQEKASLFGSSSEHAETGLDEGAATDLKLGRPSVRKQLELIRAERELSREGAAEKVKDAVSHVLEEIVPTK